MHTKTLDTKMILIEGEDGTIIIQSSTGIGVTLQGRTDKMKGEEAREAQRDNDYQLRTFVKAVKKAQK